MPAPPGRAAAVHGVADRKGEHAAEHRRDQADLHGVPDRPHGERVVEDALEMHERVVPHVEQAGGVGDEQEAAERRDDQRQQRQHHHDQQVDERQGERQPAPGSEIETARPERLAGDGREALARQHPLLQHHQRARHHHQDDRDRGGGAVERRAPVGQLEDVGGEHRDIGGRAEHGRNAVDAEHDDEGQQHAGDDRRRDQAGR